MSPLCVKYTLHVALGILARHDRLLEPHQLGHIDLAIVIRVHNAVQQVQLIFTQGSHAFTPTEGSAHELNELLPAD